MPVAKLNSALTGDSTISDAETRTFASKSVDPPHIADTTRSMIAPMNRPMIAPIIDPMIAITPIPPPIMPPSIPAPALRCNNPQIKYRTPATSP